MLYSFSKAIYVYCYRSNGAADVSQSPPISTTIEQWVSRIREEDPQSTSSAENGVGAFKSPKTKRRNHSNDRYPAEIEQALDNVVFIADHIRQEDEEEKV